MTVAAQSSLRPLDESVLSAYRNVFSGGFGQMVLQDLQDAHFLYSPLTRHPIDPLTMAYNEGQRNVVLRIMALAQIEPQINSKDNIHDRDNPSGLKPISRSSPDLRPDVNESGRWVNPGIPDFESK